jgi:YggT family protein
VNQLIAQFVSYLITILYVAIILRAVLSWLHLSPRNPLVLVVYQITEPLLAPLRRVLPRVGFMDLSPMAAILLLVLIQVLTAQLVR